VKISIVIVNYNVRHFLEQCLLSAYKALDGIEGEIFVVDNNSVDGSVGMVREKFPETHVIANAKNVGFSTANNQAIRLAKGDYVLLLNPDTVVQEDTFAKIIQYMDLHPKVGGLGVKMIDGKGNYLPESKRGMPSPMVALYKLSGLTGLFPKSKTFARYYMGHLSENETNEVDILAGAFMLLRKEALDKVGLLDETFFMYGEDIDLSYRLQIGGFTNVYFADTQIIHYKGESTKKGSLNYVFIFYQAMQIFAEKHFSQGAAKIYKYVINVAIWLRAGLSIVKRITSALLLPLVDFAVLFGGMYYLKIYWEQNHRFIQGGSYPAAFIHYAVPAYILVWLAAIFFSGGFNKPTRTTKIWRGLLVGTLTILAMYGLLSEEFRFSRALILLGAAWGFVALPGWRYVLQFISKKKLLSDTNQAKRALIVGGKEEFERIRQMLAQTGVDSDFTGWVDINESAHNESLGNHHQLAEMATIYRINEVIFCAKDLSSTEIMRLMADLQPMQTEIKIAPPESLFVIGSSSINHQGEWYAVQVNTIAQPANKRAKRTIDIGFAIIFILAAPLLVWFQKSAVAYFKNCFAVLNAKKSWVGYYVSDDAHQLPNIKSGVLNPASHLKLTSLDEETKKRINFMYAKEYSYLLDFEIVFKNLRNLGN
jgi:O-antigen biosynthesis protein